MDEAFRQKARAARREIAAGTLRGVALAALILSTPPADRDVFVDELLGLEEAPPDSAELPRGAVPYLPCGVAEILTLAHELPLRPDDTLVDLGAGLGRVVMLAHLLSGVRGRGIEVQAPLVERARARSAALDLPDVSFIHADAAAADLDGSIFFLYAPFTGPTLARVLHRLEALAQRQRITLCTVDLELSHLTWLTPRKTSSAALMLYEPHRLPMAE